MGALKRWLLEQEEAGLLRQDDPDEGRPHPQAQARRLVRQANQDTHDSEEKQA